jgi:hypothetical protein
MVDNGEKKAEKVNYAQAGLEYCRRACQSLLRQIVDELIKNPQITSRFDYAEVTGNGKILLLSKVSESICYSTFEVWTDNDGIRGDEMDKRSEQRHFDSQESLLKAIERWANTESAPAKK